MKNVENVWITQNMINDSDEDIASMKARVRE